MTDTASSLLDDDDLPADPRPAAGWRPWRLLQGLTSRLNRDDAARDSASPAPSASPPARPQASRGRALRAAHRTLKERLASHPALPQVLPHLACIERKLAKHGSKALDRLPVPVLQRGLEQLAMLQRDDETAADAAQLRVLRLRLIETMALRDLVSRQADPPSVVRHTTNRSGSRRAAASVEVSEVSTSAFNDAAVAWAHQDDLLPARPPAARH